jgi:signal transduction histidine kinase
MQRIAFSIACFFICTSCFAQQYPFVHYTPKDGLVNSRVRSAWQDSKGKMYFLTFGGLSVYDGTKFKNYTQENGLPLELVNDVLEMGDDSIWIACNTNTLSYLRQGKIKTFKTADGFCPIINKFIKTKNGAVYALADEGLFLFEKNKFIRLPFLNKQGLDAGKFLIDVIEWNNLLLVLSDHTLNSTIRSNLFLFNKSAGKVTGESEDNLIASFSKTAMEELYIVTDQGQLQLLDTIALLNSRISFLAPPDLYRNISGISYIHFDHRKNLWLRLSDGTIRKISPSGATKEFSMANGLSSNYVSGIFIDKEGTAWISMDGPGIDKLANDNIRLYEKFEGLPVSIVYANQSTNSAYVYSLAGKKLMIAGNEKISGYTDKNISAQTIAVSGDNVYISDAKRIYLLRKNKPPASLLYRDTVQPGLGNMFIDPYQNLVVCGASFLTVLIPGKPVFYYPIDYYIDQVTFDKTKRLWGITRNGKLFVLKINPDKPEKYLEILKTYALPRPELSPRSVAADHFNHIWIGTRHDGLYCFQLDDKLDISLYRHYTTKDGLSDNFITHLTCDNENNIWVSTASGLDKIRFTGKQVRIENITRSNNIYEYIPKTFVDKNGMAWSYTSDGNLICVDRNVDEWPSVTPALLMTEFKTGDSAFASPPEPGSFSHTENSFSFSVAAASFYDEQQIKYSYQLQGSGNDHWSEPSKNPTFNFINLNPGKYTLNVKAAFPGGRYPDQTAGYTFTIHPPWWQTWWFRITALLSIIGLLIVGTRLYYRRKLERQKARLEKQQAVEQERTRIATDIHDDLGSGLSRIRYLGEMVKLKTIQRQNVLPDIEKISAFSDEMVDKMNEIVWALNEKNDSLEAIIAYTRSFAAEYLSNNNIQCKAVLPDEIPAFIVKGETRRNIFLSVKECLHNVVKHAGASEVLISISASKNLVILIHDNGKGIEWDKIRQFSNGMMNIKKRMKDAGGTVDFKNEEGTKVELSIPLL